MTVTQRIQQLNAWLTFGGYIAAAFLLVTGVTIVSVFGWLTAQAHSVWLTLNYSAPILLCLCSWIAATCVAYITKRRAGSWRARVGAILIAGAAVLFFVGVVLIARDQVAASVTASPSASEPANSSKKLLTAYDVEARLRAIDQLFQKLAEPVMEVSAEGERLNKKLSEKLMSNTAEAALLEHALNTEKALINYFSVAGRYTVFPDIHHDATALVWNPFEVVSSSRNLAAEIRRLSGASGSVELTGNLQNNKHLSEFQNATSGRFWTWINEKQNLLTVLRRHYESAEIYQK